MSYGILPNGKQQFIDSNGNPLAGGKVYYYIPSTTTPKNTYQNDAGSILNTNPVVLDASGQCIVYGTGSYRQQVFDVNNNLIWDQQVDTPLTSSNQTYDIQEQTFTATAGQTVFVLTNFSYAPGANNLTVFVNGLKQIVNTNYLETSSTVITFTTGLNVGAIVDLTAAVLQTSASVISAAIVLYQYPASGAVSETVQAKLQQTVSVLDFGANPTGTTDSGPAFRAAILTCAKNGGGKVIAPYGTYNITSTVIIPSLIILDLENSTITGPCIGSSTDLFQTGYLSSGTIVTNIGTSPESNQVSFTTITNAVINNCGKAFNLYDFLNGCEVSNIAFTNCTYAIYSDRSFYSRFVNLTSRGTANSATNAAIYFNNVNNVQQIESCFVIGRTLGWDIEGGSNALVLFNCSAESCATGVQIGGTTGPIKFDTCYFENNSVVAVTANTSYDKDQISFSNCFFNGNALGIKGAPNGNQATLIIDRTNRFYLNTADVNLSGDSVFNQSYLEWTPSYINSGLITIPSTVTLGASTQLNETQLYASSGGSAEIKSKVYGSTLIPFEHDGNGGNVSGIGIPFCTYAQGGSGASSTLIVTTSIIYNQFTTNLIYNLSIADTSTTTVLYGFIFGNVVKPMDSTGKTVTVSTNGSGCLVLTLGNFNTTINPTGIIRFI